MATVFCDCCPRGFTGTVDEVLTHQPGRLSKLCEACGERYEKPADMGLAKWMTRATCGKPECIRRVKKRLMAGAMGHR